MALFTIYLVILVALGILEIVLLEMEHFGRATFLILGTALGVQFLGLADIWHFVLGHFVLTLEYMVGYVMVGVVWSFFRWWRYLSNWKTDYVTKRNEYLKNNGLPADNLSEVQLTELRKALLSYDSAPAVSSNKSKITAWMCFWVFSMIGWSLNEPVRRLFNSLFNLFKNIYQRIVDYMFKDLKELK